MSRILLAVACALTLGGVLVLGLIRSRSSDETGGARIDYGRIPDFTLVQSDGQTVQRGRLLGKLWVADFIFTSCAGTCPLMSGQMRKLQDSLPAEVQLVSITVDPSRDSPEVLARYARQLGADRNRWLFLTGQPAEIRRLCLEGFKLALYEGAGSAAEPITHSSRFVLVDRAGTIRGYYSGTEDADFARLAGDVKNLL
jgi:cytochrome oxidase Cu insertion factor (SCO1/SenC/PrrC family)